jgi:hypothetical protein
MLSHGSEDMNVKFSKCYQLLAKSIENATPVRINVFSTNL